MAVAASVNPLYDIQQGGGRKRIDWWQEHRYQDDDHVQCKWKNSLDCLRLWMREMLWRQPKTWLEGTIGMTRTPKLKNQLINMNLNNAIIYCNDFGQVKDWNICCFLTWMIRWKSLCSTVYQRGSHVTQTQAYLHPLPCWYPEPSPGICAWEKQSEKHYLRTKDCILWLNILKMQQKKQP